MLLQTRSIRAHARSGSEQVSCMFSVTERMRDIRDSPVVYAPVGPGRSGLWFDGK